MDRQIRCVMGNVEVAYTQERRIYMQSTAWQYHRVQGSNPSKCEVFQVFFLQLDRLHL